MDKHSKKILHWTSKLDTYYKAVSKKKLFKDLTKAGFKVNQRGEKNNRG